MSGSLLTGVKFPSGWRVETLSKQHDRKSFSTGQANVDSWIHSSALQSQTKRLSVTKVLLDDAAAIVGFYTLATSQIDFSELPMDVAKKLPNRRLPVAVLAWFGIKD